jgi:cyclophilin family peptidyl-prolyl cis-trans isomerase
MLAIIAGITLLAVVLGTVAASLVGQGSTDSASTSSTTSSTAPPPSVPTVSVTIPAAGAAVTGETPCPAADGSSPRTTSFESAPPTCIDTTKTYTATLETTEGPITILLNAEQAPNLVNNFVVLSRYHFYDGVPFFFVLPDTFVASGDATGDPIGTGTPGYTLPDEIPEAGAIYPWGTVAMVNGTGEADANGSTFLIASGERSADIPPTYSIIGQVLDGDDAIRAINQQGDPTTGQPTKDIRIERVTIAET